MASGSISLSTRSTDRVTGAIIWSSVKKPEENCSLVNIEIWVYMNGYGIQGIGNGTWDENGSLADQFNPQCNVPYGGSGNAKVFEKSGIRVNHDEKGDGKITLGTWMDFSFAGVTNLTGSGVAYMDHIDRKPVLTITSTSNITLNTIDVSYRVDSGQFYGLEYRLNAGNWKSISGNPKITIKDLEPNTNYKIELRGFNQDKTLIGNASNSQMVKTLDICRMSQIEDFKLGTDLDITYNAIANVTNKIAILDKNKEELITYRECNNGKYTFVLSEAEKEKIYKKFSNNEKGIKVLIVLKSIQNNKEYIDNKEVNVLLTGDVCSAIFMLNGILKKCKVWVGTSSGVNKQGIFVVGTSEGNKRGV